MPLMLDDANHRVGHPSDTQLSPNGIESRKEKLPDLNTTSVEQAMKSIEGTARSMGITISD